MAFPKIVYSTSALDGWIPNHAYATSDQVLDQAFHIQQAAPGGTSGVSQPAFSDSGGLVAEGPDTLKWQDEGLGPVTTLQFRFPPVKQPYRDYAAVRHTNIASSGVQENVWERTDAFLDVDMEWVVGAADVAAWDTFIQQALQGAFFQYYPDASVGSYTLYYLADDKWVSEYLSPQAWKFRARFRQRVAWP